jgi:hypothetical protein
VEKVMNLSETMEKSVSVLKLKTALSSYPNDYGSIGLAKSGKMVKNI